MKRVLAVALAIVICSMIVAQAQTVNELITENIEARGGMDALEAIQTMKSTGKILAQGLELGMTMYNKRPNKFRMDLSLQGMEMVQAFDGETGWSINPMMGNAARKMSPLESENTRLQANFDGFLINYEDKGYKVEYGGKQDMEGTPTEMLKVTINDSTSVDIYLDAEYYLDLKMTFHMTIAGKENSLDITFADYKETAGVMMPYTLAMGSDQQGQAGQIALDTIEVNVDVPDSIFVMPESVGADSTQEGGGR